MYREGPRNEGLPELYLTKAEVAAWLANGVTMIRPHVMLSMIVGYHFCKRRCNSDDAADLLFRRSVTNWKGTSPELVDFLRQPYHKQFLLGDDCAVAPLIDALNRSGWTPYMSADTEIWLHLGVSEHAAWEVIVVNDHRTMSSLSQLITIIMNNGFGSSVIGKQTEKRMARIEGALALIGRRSREHPAVKVIRARAVENTVGNEPLVKRSRYAVHRALLGAWIATALAALWYVVSVLKG